MGRILLLALVILAVYLMWRAFGPGSSKRLNQSKNAAADPPAIKGPDDDEDFLWNIEKQRFKERRAREEAERRAKEEEERRRRRSGDDPAS
ncbi:MULTISPECIES: hypothetical protein [unclassified Corynebacterium]|uniref:hypothetical protein n=1 Tax=unclassified Corynebacterium TaxID=2624378 RepID=UPI002A917513|nr:hypothetical protein [Corynebacterium sp.]MDY5784782.1 hypothetical protein [Corynebacterium sp.]